MQKFNYVGQCAEDKYLSPGVDIVDLASGLLCLSGSNSTEGLGDLDELFGEN